MSKLHKSHVDTLVYKVLLQVTAGEAVYTRAHAGRGKARRKRLITRVRNIMFPLAPSVREKKILPSVVALETRVRNIRNLVPYNLDETLVKSVKKVKKVIEKV